MNIQLYTVEELRSIPGISPPLECMLRNIKEFAHGQLVRIYYRKDAKYIIKAYRDQYNEGFTLEIEQQVL